LLFEDLFKKMNSELLMEARKTLAKASRTTSFDAVANIRSDIVTHAMEAALSTGCWNIKRFRMDRKGATQVRSPPIPPLSRTQLHDEYVLYGALLLVILPARYILKN
jgi:hypothetical protein